MRLLGKWLQSDIIQVDAAHVCIQHVVASSVMHLPGYPGQETPLPEQVVVAGQLGFILYQMRNERIVYSRHPLPSAAYVLGRCLDDGVIVESLGLGCQEVPCLLDGALRSRAAAYAVLFHFPVELPGVVEPGMRHHIHLVGRGTG